MTEIWSKPSGPILTATLPWENGTLYQPWPIYLGNNSWRMWYGAGWNATGIGQATCQGDPTIAANWKKMGSTAWWAGPDFNAVFVRNGLYYILVEYANQIYMMWSADPTAPPGQWFEERVVLAASPSLLDNTICGPSLIFDGDEIDLFYIGSPVSPLTYRQFLARMSKGIFNYPPNGQFTKDQRSPLKSLQLPGTTGEYGITGNIQKVGNNWNAWQHCSVSGNLPTDIYHVYSPDKINWSFTSTQPVISRSMLWNTGVYDQVADCVVIEATDIGMTYAFYDACNNTIPSCAISVSSINGPLSSICP